MSRVALASIPSLTLYRDALTATRRGQPIQQLECLGKACRLFTPDVVRCVNMGGAGNEVDWKCEADLPEALRLGRVEVSCEGWSGPGDSDVLKGSCSLAYRLLEVPNVLRSHKSASFTDRYSKGQIAYFSFWIALLIFINYKILKGCCSASSNRSAPRSPPRLSGYGVFPGDHRDEPPPPPYSKPPPYSPSPPASPPSQMQSGPSNFLAGAALGGLGTYMLTRQRPEPSPRPQYDWERERVRPGPSVSVFEPGTRGNPGGLFSRTQRQASRFDQSDDGRESSSDLGPMRTSTGYGGSSVR
ncbi:DUF1183-domain-containing protein [Artomyces pyxidatus]|uniref:DUF1183-domain-containing protein n=1 Tax=Artomyces pyxidatus TaxID=48021 RepID=A0ACB8SQ82_9AGAM|nr:DUF1183-domain-containing protein [Artomyces pyxidatus]